MTPFPSRNRSTSELYLIALPATHLRRCAGFVTSVQVFYLTHVYDAAIPAQSRQHESRFLSFGINARAESVGFARAHPNGGFCTTTAKRIFLSRIIHFVAWRPPVNHFLKPASRPLLPPQINLARNQLNYFDCAIA